VLNAEHRFADRALQHLLISAMPIQKSHCRVSVTSTTA
jgi:hypothetical protein